MNSSAFFSDQKTIDAVIRNLEIIGEAATHVPPEIQLTHPQIPWAQMKGIRNILIHEYFGVDEDVVWQTIQKNLPQLTEQLQKLSQT